MLKRRLLLEMMNRERVDPLPERKFTMYKWTRKDELIFLRRKKRRFLKLFVQTSQPTIYYIRLFVRNFLQLHIESEGYVNFALCRIRSAKILKVESKNSKQIGFQHPIENQILAFSAFKSGEKRNFPEIFRVNRKIFSAFNGTWFIGGPIPRKFI